MVNFGVRLRKEQYGLWSVEYINYEQLKQILDDIKKASGRATPGEVDAQKSKFQETFAGEITKVLAFYSRTSSKLTDLGKRLETRVGHMEGDGEQETLEILEELQNLGIELAHLINYVSLNMTGIRKSLKKYAKNVELSPPLPEFLSLKTEHPSEKGSTLTQGTFLKMEVAHQLDNMVEHRELTQLVAKVKSMFETVKASLGGAELGVDVEAGTEADVISVGSVARRQSVEKSRTLFSQNSSHHWSARVEDSAELPVSPGAASKLQRMHKLLETLDEAEAKARRNARLVHAVSWADAQAGILEPPPRDEDAVATRLGLWMNCISSGLYMANYNLVIPSLSAMCDHINVDPSVVGLVIGCCDVTTIFGTVGYSLWTDRSYKQPLIASAVACIVGNLAYCLSYDMAALWLLILARLLTGLGSARTVNRRYIAMYVAKKDRTAASALFVSLSAVGMALGPLLALPLSRMPSISFLGVSFNDITMGGWVMTACWLLFLVVAAVAFEEPLHPKAVTALSMVDPLRQPLLGDEAQQRNGPLHTIVSSEVAALGTGTYEAQPSFSSSMSDDEEEDDGDWADEAYKRLSKFFSSPAVATACCISLCFVLKLVQQAYIDGLSIFTEKSFDWTASQCGILLGVFGLAAPIVNQSVGHLSSRISDRTITVASIVTTGVGAFALMKGPFPKWSFFSAGVLVYMGTIVLEAVSMSLTSKVIDERLAKGLWNAGLLSTQAGTLGRLSGNLVLSLSAGITGTRTLVQLDNLARVLFGACAGIMVVSLGYVGAVYGRLVG